MTIRLVDKRMLSKTDWEEVVHRSVGAVCSRRGFLIGGAVYLASIDTLLAASVRAEISAVFNQTVRSSFVAGAFTDFRFMSEDFAVGGGNGAIYGCIAPMPVAAITTGAFCYNEIDQYYYGKSSALTAQVVTQEVATFEHSFTVEKEGASQHWRVASIEAAYTAYVGT